MRANDRLDHTMTVHLFDPSRERTDTDSIRPSETEFEYLNRTARPEVSEARALMNDWFAAYPDAERDVLRGRLFNKNAETVQGALFELYVYTSLRTIGFTVEVNPQLAGRTPDFGLVAPGGARAHYLEATTIAAKSHHGETIHKLNREAAPRIEIPGFALELKHRGMSAGSGGISATKFAEWVNAWFRDAQMGCASDTKTFECVSSGWRLPFRLIRLDEPNLKLEDEVIAIQCGEGVWLGDQPAERLRNVVRSKHRRYGAFGLPFVVAVASNDPLYQADPRTVAKALWSVVEGGESAVGVILLNGCYPTGLLSREPELWDNPRSPADRLLRPWPLRRVSEDVRSHEPAVDPGTSFREILGMPAK